MKVLRIVLGLILILMVALGIALAGTRPEPLEPGTESAARLEPGPYAVDLSERVWVDDTRPTDRNGDYPGAPDRRFEVAIWSPRSAPGPYPLVVYSHGFMSNARGGTHIAEHLASHGYVVVATSYPLTHFGAPGGPNANDVFNQPADVSFLIDQMLELGPEDRPFEGGIDRNRIAVIGVSLGALTSTLVAYHPSFADPRISAAISIAGPGAMFGPRYFDRTRVPFLMIAGTHDAMIQYEENALPIPDRIRDGGLVTLDGGSHAGFTYLTAGPMRLLGNPDEIGCWSLMQNLEVDETEDLFANLGDAESGILDASDASLPCEVRFEEAMPAGRQHWLTMLATRAFLESRFALDPEVRRENARYLRTTFGQEIPDAHYTPPTPARRS